jgi:hypothetical protein
MPSRFLAVTNDAMPRPELGFRLASLHSVRGRYRDDELLGAGIEPHDRARNMAFGSES